MPLSQTSALDIVGGEVIAGEGVAGTPTGGVITIQGITNGTAVNVQQPLDVTSSTINVTTQDLVSAAAVGFANQSLITGTPTANSAASFVVNSIQTVMVLISGTWTGTLSTEVSEDGGTTWEPRSIHVIGTSTFASAVTANVAGSMNAAGKSNVRVRATSAITGTAVVKIVMSDNPSNFYIANAIKLVDGSSTISTNMLTIKAANTAAVAADTAAVVAISPNNTVIVQGASGSPGTPSGGILTIQGVTAGSPIPTSAKTALIPASPTTASVGVTTASALAANANRTGLIIINNSINKVSFGLGVSAVLNSGITLYPGGVWNMDQYSFTSLTINAIASAVASSISIQEFS